MNVLFDAHMIGQQRTGLERYSHNLLQALSKHGGEELDLAIYSHLPRHQLSEDYSSFSVYTPVNSHGLYRVLLGFNQAVEHLKPDILHVNFFVPVHKTVPLVTTIHDVCFKRFPKFEGIRNRLLFNIFLRRSLELSDAIICVSKSVKKDIIDFFSVNPEDIFVIYEAPYSVFQFKSDKEKVRREIDIKFSINKKYFLVVGNIEDKKSIEPIIKAFTLMVRKQEDLQLVFAGPNKKGNFLLRQYKSIYQEGKVRILSYVDDGDLNLLYNGAQALILNSVCEGFGLPIVEAMRCRLPVICRDIPVFREIAAEAAIFVQGRNELYQAMNRVIEDRYLRNKYSKLGYIRSLFFSWEKAARETMMVYEKIVKNQKLKIKS